MDHPFTKGDAHLASPHRTNIIPGEDILGADPMYLKCSHSPINYLCYLTYIIHLSCWFFDALHIQRQLQPRKLSLVINVTGVPVQGSYSRELPCKPAVTTSMVVD